MKDNLPNFLIVGAAKSGTSSLHNYLNQHPEVFMPSYDKKGMKVKEPRFLIKGLVQHRLHNGIWSWEEYQSLDHESPAQKAAMKQGVFEDPKSQEFKKMVRDKKKAEKAAKKQYNMRSESLGVARARKFYQKVDE